MKTLPKIGAGQLFMFLLLSRVMLTLTYSINSGDHTIDNADWFAALLMPPFLIVLALPTFGLLKFSKNTTICDYAYTLSKPIGIIVSVLYAIVFLTLSFTAVSRFSFFVTSTMQPEKGSYFFPILIMVFVCFAAIKGVQAIMRTSAVLTVVSLISILLIIVALIPRFDALNIVTPLYDGWQKVGSSVALLLSNSLELIAILMLAPNVKGSLVKAYGGYVILAPLCLFLVFYTTMAVLGPYGRLQLFPFFSTAGIAKIGELSNLSALEASVWILGVFIKSSLYLFLCFQCLSKIIPNKFRNLSIWVLGILVVVAAVISSDNVAIAQTSFSIYGMLATNCLFVVVLPLLLLGVGMIKRRKDHVQSH